MRDGKMMDEMMKGRNDSLSRCVSADWLKHRIKRRLSPLPLPLYSAVLLSSHRTQTQTRKRAQSWMDECVPLSLLLPNNHNVLCFWAGQGRTG